MGRMELKHILSSGISPSLWQLYRVRMMSSVCPHFTTAVYRVCLNSQEQLETSKITAHVIMFNSATVIHCFRGWQLRNYAGRTNKGV